MTKRITKLAIVNWAHNMGLDCTVSSNGGPCFEFSDKRSAWTETVTGVQLAHQWLRGYARSNIRVIQIQDRIGQWVNSVNGGGFE